jgi:hypothetical protein
VNRPEAATGGVSGRPLRRVPGADPDGFPDLLGSTGEGTDRGSFYEQFPHPRLSRRRPTGSIKARNGEGRRDRTWQLGL